MTDTSTDTSTELETTTLEAPDTGASVVEAPDSSADAQYPWSSEHPEWKPEDAWKSYTELRTKQSRGEPEAPQPAAEEAPYDPYADLPAGDDPALVEDLAAIFGGQKTFTDGRYGPQAVLEWLAKSPQTLSGQTRGQFFVAWQQQDPWTAQQWMAQQAYAADRDQIREELRQEYQPAVESTRAAMNSTAISLASQEIDNFEEWAPKVTEYLEKENPYALQGVQGAQQVADRICDIVGLLSMRDQRAQRRTANQAPAAPPPSAATQTRSKQASAPKNDREKAALDGMARVRKHM